MATAERCQVSVSTAARWACRYRDHGEAGLADRTSPNRTPSRTERRVIKVRVLRRWGPARIGYLLGLNPSTVHRILTRYRLDEWAYAQPYRTEAERRQALPGWLHTYNHYRGHTALAGQPPAGRVLNLTGQYG